MMLFQNIMKLVQEIIEDCNDNEYSFNCRARLFVYTDFSNRYYLKNNLLKFPNNATAMIVDYSNGNFKLEQILDPIL